MLVSVFLVGLQYRKKAIRKICQVEPASEDSFLGSLMEDLSSPYLGEAEEKNFPSIMFK